MVFGSSSNTQGRKPRRTAEKERPPSRSSSAQKKAITRISFFSSGCFPAEANTKEVGGSHNFNCRSFGYSRMDRNISGPPQRTASSLKASGSDVVSSSNRLVDGLCKPLKETKNGSGHDDDQQMLSAAILMTPSVRRSALVGSSCDGADLEKELESFTEVAPPVVSSTKTTTITPSSVDLACEHQHSSSSGSVVIPSTTSTSICPQSSSFRGPPVASLPISNQEGGRTTDARSKTSKVAQLVSAELSSPWCRYSKRDTNKHEVTDGGALARTLNSAPSTSLTAHPKADLDSLDGPFLRAPEKQADTTTIKEDEEDDDWGQLHRHSVQKRGQAVMPNIHRHSQRSLDSSGENKQNHHNHPGRPHMEVSALPQTRCASFPAYRGGADAPQREIAEIERTGLGNLFPIIPAHPLRESSTETSIACEGADIESPEENVDDERSRHDLVFSSEAVQSGSSDLSLLTKKERILSILDSALQVIESTGEEYLFDVPSSLGSCGPAELIFSRRFYRSRKCPRRILSPPSAFK